MVRRGVALVLLWAVGTVLAQPQGRVAKGPLSDAELERLLASGFTDSSTVRMIVLPTTVTDRRGRLVTGLTREDFRVFENQVPQQIQLFASQTAEPVSIAFLLDVSGSMRFQDKLVRSQEAIRAIVRVLGPRDRFALIGFADEQVDWITDFTSDKRSFLARLDVQEGYGQTALHDAVASAPQLVDAQAQGRRAIVLFTDGIDTSSRLPIAEAVALARRVAVPIYAVAFLPVERELLPKDETLSDQRRVLARVAEETGGRLFLVGGPTDLEQAMATLDLELRHQYVLGYYPHGTPRPGQFQSVRVEVRDGRFDARTRSGYVIDP